MRKRLEITRLCLAFMVACPIAGRAIQISVDVGPFSVDFYGSGEAVGGYAGDRDWVDAEITAMTSAINQWDQGILNTAGRDTAGGPTAATGAQCTVHGARIRRRLDADTDPDWGGSSGIPRRPPQHCLFHVFLCGLGVLRGCHSPALVAPASSKSKSLSESIRPRPVCP